jgi:hypothetical protein
MYCHHETGTVQACRYIIRRNIRLGGNRRLKIYGTLSCSSGKRMKTINRVFFADEEEAKGEGYRPCGHCMPEQYKLWKSAQKKLLAPGGH